MQKTEHGLSSVRGRRVASLIRHSINPMMENAAKTQGTGSIFIDCLGNQAYHLVRETSFKKEVGDWVVSCTLTSRGREDRGKALWTVKDPKGFFSIRP